MAATSSEDVDRRDSAEMDDVITRGDSGTGAVGAERGRGVGSSLDGLDITAVIVLRREGTFPDVGERTGGVIGGRRAVACSNLVANEDFGREPVRLRPDGASESSMVRSMMSSSSDFFEVDAAFLRVPCS